MDIKLRKQVQEWAKTLIKEGFAVLDTETTDHPRVKPEAVQVGLVYCHPGGLKTETLMDTLVRPIKPIQPGAQAKHGIPNEAVADALPFDAIWCDLLRYTSPLTHLVIYNRQFDLEVVRSSLSARGIKILHCQDSKSRPDQKVWYTGAGVHCAMLQYAKWVQEPGRYGDFKWQKLPDYGFGAHSAAGDCLSTIEVIRRMAVADLSLPLLIESVPEPEELAIEVPAEVPAVVVTDQKFS